MHPKSVQGRLYLALKTWTSSQVEEEQTVNFHVLKISRYLFKPLLQH
jgi:hypothetical protein